MPASLGQRGVLPHAGEDRLGVPQDQPDRDADQHGDPQPLPHGAADVAHRMAVAAEFGRHHRRGRIHQAEPEDQRREIEVGAERAGGKHAGARPAHHHDVGRRHRDLGEVGQNHRPAQRERRANLVAPRGFRRLHAGFDRRHFPVFQIAKRSNRPIFAQLRAANPWIPSRSRGSFWRKMPEMARCAAACRLGQQQLRGSRRCPESRSRRLVADARLDLGVEQLRRWRQHAVLGGDQAVGLHDDIEVDRQDLDGAGQPRLALDEVRDLRPKRERWRRTAPP